MVLVDRLLLHGLLGLLVVWTLSVLLLQVAGKTMWCLWVLQLRCVVA